MSVKFQPLSLCADARARFETTDGFESRRQFLLDHVEKIVYRRYKVTVVGSVPVILNPAPANMPAAVPRLPFQIEGEIDPTTLHTGPRRKCAEDGRLKARGSGGRVKISAAHVIVKKSCFAL
jgi:hypothetical protein